MKYTPPSEVSVSTLYKNGKSQREIATILNSSESTIHKIVKRLGLQSQYVANLKYHYKEDFFDIINTESKAYFLGLMYADGSLRDKKGKKSFSLGLMEPDRHIIEELIKCLETDKPIKIDKRGDPNRKALCVFSTACARLYKGLIKCGCVPRKSLILTFPNETILPKNLIHHFIRGYFDGDGCIHIGKTKSASINICVSEAFGIKLQEIIRSLGINCKFHKRPNAKIHLIDMGGIEQVRVFRDWLYDDATVFLYRKKKIFDAIPLPTKIRHQLEKENKDPSLFVTPSTKQNLKLLFEGVIHRPQRNIL